jgi:hypothetical protein
MDATDQVVLVVPPLRLLHTLMLTLRLTLDCIHPIVSKATKGGTSNTKTIFPSASGMSMCVICAYPAGVTSHPPMGSPAAASNPAETTSECPKIPNTNHKLWIEFISDRQHHFLKRINVVGIPYVPYRPWNVHISLTVRAVDQKGHTFQVLLLRRSSAGSWLLCLLDICQIYEVKYIKRSDLI